MYIHVNKRLEKYLHIFQTHIRLLLVTTTGKGISTGVGKKSG